MAPNPSPLAEPDTDRLLRALADATRRALLDRLRDRPGLTLGELAAGFPSSRQALSKHLAVLEATQLVVALWRGREKLHYLNPLPLQALPARWVTTTARETGAALAALKQALQPQEAATALGRQDAVTAALRRNPGPGLAGRTIASAESLAAARDYLAGTADAVSRLLERLARHDGYDKPVGGGFSLAEHLWHLADIEEIGWAPRCERLLAERRPRLADVDGDRLAVERRYQERPWRGAARRFIAQRRRSLRALGQFTTETLGAPAHFGDRRTTGGEVIAAMVAHDREHRAEMSRLWTRSQGVRPNR